MAHKNSNNPTPPAKSLQKKNRPCVLYAGSSIFASWTQVARVVDGITPEIPVVNTAISGTQTHDWISTLGPIAQHHQPAVLCLYIGSNDVGNFKDHDTITHNLQTIFDRVAAASPRTLTLYHSIIRSADKQDRWPTIDAIHTTIQAEIANRPAVRFLDINPVFYDGAESSPPNTPPTERYPAAQLRPHYFVQDRLHLTDPAYEHLLRFTAAHIAEAINQTPTS